MAIVTKDSGSKKKQKIKEKVAIDLPWEDEAHEPETDLSKYTTLIYGRKGIGKTSLAAQFPDPYFLCLEPGTKALRVRSTNLHNFEEIKAFLKILKKKEGTYKTLVIDTIDFLYTHIYNSVCDDLGVSSPTEMDDWGATWGVIKRTFRQMIDKILSLDCGKVFISHDVEKEITLRDGTKTDRVQPTMSKQALHEIEAIVDIIGCYDYDGEDRYLHIDGKQNIVAKARPEENFIIRGGTAGVPGDRVKSIFMGRSSKESYANLVKAFENRQVTADGRPKMKEKLLMKKKSKD